MDAALRLLKFRDRSEGELFQRLEQKGFSAGAIGSVVQRLKELSLVNDERLARQLVEAGRRGGQGERRLRQTLTNRGIPKSLTQGALVPSDEETERERLERTIKKLWPKFQGLPKPVAQRRLAGRLIRQGFLADDIHAVTRDLFHSNPDEPDE